MPKLEAFADDKSNVTQNLKVVLGRVEHIVEKGEKCWLLAFSPFPHCFQKPFFSGLLKVGIGWYRVKLGRGQNNVIQEKD